MKQNVKVLDGICKSPVYRAKLVCKTFWLDLNLFCALVFQPRKNDYWHQVSIRSFNREIRQGDAISPKLFTAALDAFRLLDWNWLGINIIGERITHLRFDGDVVIMAETMEHLSIMLDDFNRVSK